MNKHTLSHIHSLSLCLFIILFITSTFRLPLVIFCTQQQQIIVVESIHIYSLYDTSRLKGIFRPLFSLSLIQSRFRWTVSQDSYLKAKWERRSLKRKRRWPKRGGGKRELKLVTQTSGRTCIKTPLPREYARYTCLPTYSVWEVGTRAYLPTVYDR